MSQSKKENVILGDFHRLNCAFLYMYILRRLVSRCCFVTPLGCGGESEQRHCRINIPFVWRGCGEKAQESRDVYSIVREREKEKQRESGWGWIWLWRVASGLGEIVVRASLPTDDEAGGILMGCMSMGQITTIERHPHQHMWYHSFRII